MLVANASATPLRSQSGEVQQIRVAEGTALMIGSVPIVVRVKHATANASLHQSAVATSPKPAPPAPAPASAPASAQASSDARGIPMWKRIVIAMIVLTATLAIISKFRNPRGGAGLHSASAVESGAASDASTSDANPYGPIERLIAAHRRYDLAYQAAIAKVVAKADAAVLQAAGADLVAAGNAVNEIEESRWTKRPIVLPELPEDASFTARERHEAVEKALLIAKWGENLDQERGFELVPTPVAIGNGGIRNLGRGPEGETLVPVPGIDAMLQRRELLRTMGYCFAFEPFRHAIDASVAYVQDDPKTWAREFANAIQSLPDLDIDRLRKVGRFPADRTDAELARASEVTIYQEFLGQSRNDKEWIAACRQAAPDEMKRLDALLR